MGPDGATVGVRERYRRSIVTASLDGTLIRFWCRSELSPIVSAIRQHDPPHRTAGAVDPGQQSSLRDPATAAVVAYAVEDVAYQHVALGRVRLGKHPFLAAAVAHEAEEPRRKHR